jgi:2-polyprenyl-3-methyl-5-hydroxy-6-metoxy-1,4-benzoquinol methylase
MEFRSRRSRSIGVDIVRSWARSLPARAAVLDLGCGDGVPITQVLLDTGLEVYAVDASPSMIEAFREHFPGVPAECASAMTSEFFRRNFDGVIAWGLLFLLTAEDQRGLIQRVAGALVSGGHFLFTAPIQRCEWIDIITGRTSISLGGEEYRSVLRDVGLRVTSESDDEGGNHYYSAIKS